MPDGGLESLKLELSRGKDVGQDGKVFVFDRARVHAPQAWLTCLLEKRGFGLEAKAAHLISCFLQSGWGTTARNPLPRFLSFLVTAHFVSVGCGPLSLPLVFLGIFLRRVACL